MLIVVNMSKLPSYIDISEVEYRKGHCILSTHGIEPYSRVLSLKPFEARIYKIR